MVLKGFPNVVSHHQYNIGEKPTVLCTVVVVVFFTLTDRASTIPNNTRGCQSGTWSAGQKTKLYTYYINNHHVLSAC